MSMSMQYISKNLHLKKEKTKNPTRRCRIFRRMINNYAVMNLLDYYIKYINMFQ